MEKFKCSNCGKLIDINVTECPKCGAIFEEESVDNTKTVEETRPLSMEEEFEVDTLKTCKYLKDVGNAILGAGIMFLIFSVILGAVISGQPGVDSSIVFIYILIGAFVFGACLFSKYMYQWMSCLLKGTYLIYKKK